jgi:hypothetical protein
MFSVWSVRWLYHEYEASSTKTVVRTVTTEEYKRSTAEELTQCDYSKIEAVISNCKFRVTIYPTNRA